MENELKTRVKIEPLAPSEQELNTEQAETVQGGIIIINSVGAAPPGMSLLAPGADSRTQKV